ncbi:MAG TPA: hypothetical protein PLA94_00790 [Myxococcota bacterium]|nr:hypothetical protein [Myxococcota bacterium]
MKVVIWIADLLHVSLLLSLLSPLVGIAVWAEWALLPLPWMVAFSMIPLLATTAAVICLDLQLVGRVRSLPGSRLVWGLAVVVCPLLAAPLLWWFFGKPDLEGRLRVPPVNGRRAVLTRFEPLPRAPRERTPSGPVLELPDECWENEHTLQLRPVVRPLMQTFVEQAPPPG